MKKVNFLFSLLLALAACSTGDKANGGVATGMLQTRDYIITMYAGNNGALYSIRSPNGDLLDENVNMETMVARFPELEYLQDNDNIEWAGLEDDNGSLDLDRIYESR